MRAKKSLGQNWLNSEAVREKIITAAALNQDDIVLEIGPGLGFLTEALLKKVRRVVAVEKDDRLIDHLKNRFQAEIAAQKLVLLPGDVADPALGHPMSKLLRDQYKIVANIPYYLTGQILRQFLEARSQPKSMVLMLQKEVAKRIVAQDGKESLLSISVKVFGQPRYVATVPAKCFNPAPKVDSAILAINNISRTTTEESKFFDILKQGFAHKRKLLASNLGCSTDLLIQAKIDPKARAENLTVDQWLHLTTLITASNV